MSEGPSDPDLLDLSDLPNTGSIAAATDLGPQVRIIGRGVEGLLRWAKRVQKERHELKGLLWRGIIAIVLGALGMMTTVAGFGVYLGIRLERMGELERKVARLESNVYGVDAVATASEEP